MAEGQSHGEQIAKARLPVEIQQAVTSAQRPFREIARNNANIVHWEDEAMFAIQALANNSLLQRCEPYTVRDSVINVAAIGLSLNPKLQHCALIPRYNTRKKRYECHADPMYQGLLKLATDGGNVLNVWCGIVYQDEWDEGRFKYRLGSEPYIFHEPSHFDNHHIDNAIGAYCCAEIKDSRFPKIELMWRETILEIMESSEMVKYARKNNQKITGPWADRPEEMWKKTVLKRGQKTWPKGQGRLELAIHHANVAEGYIEPSDEDIPGEAQEVVKTISAEQAKELRSMCRQIGMKVDKVYNAYGVGKMEELPVEEYESAKNRIMVAGLINSLRHASPGDEFFAEDYGLTLKQLEGYGAEAQTQASLFSKRT